jgi:hypothetical protein
VGTSPARHQAGCGVRRPSLGCDRQPTGRHSRVLSSTPQPPWRPPGTRWPIKRGLPRDSQSAWLVNYAERHRAGLRVGTSLTEGTANVLVNRRMNKSQQMRWSRRGADLLLQVRCAGFNGKLGSSVGQLFQAVDPAPGLAMAA